MVNTAAPAARSSAADLSDQFRVSAMPMANTSQPADSKGRKPVFGDPYGFLMQMPESPSGFLMFKDRSLP
jgi:hypothetical protein